MSVKNKQRRERNRVTNFSYRSGIEAGWRCKRAQYLEQDYLGTGIQKAPRAFYLDVGIAVHIGLAAMLEHFGVLFVDRDDCDLSNPKNSQTNEHSAKESCIAEALLYWDTCGQRAVLTEYQFNEQRCLIEALLWAFYYRSLRTFLETYEVLWVEKEMTEIVAGRPRYMMMSRPDAIVRDRQTGEIVVISWKTIDRPTTFRRLFFKQDLQGMMEAHYTEEWLASGWRYAKSHPEEFAQSKWPIDNNPPKVSYVQTIYLVKGDRMRKEGYAEDEGVGDAFADEAMGDEWRQNTHLIYPYSNIQMLCGHPEYSGDTAFESLAWKYRHVKPGNKSFSTLGNAFKKTLITNTSMSIREWVCALNDGTVFPSTLLTEAGKNALENCVVWENPSYRDEEMMGSVLRQVKESERKRHRDRKVLAKFEGVEPGTENKWPSMLDKLFPQQLVSCNFPWKCQFIPVCHQEDGRAALKALEMPRGYVARVAHHESERLYQIEGGKK
jgi:hypothetical protein